jgi:phosphatidylglycerol:prolipoprotein diacylglycerol transferase
VPYAYAFGLSGIQWVCVLALACYLPFVWRHYRAAPRNAYPAPPHKVNP